MTRVAILATLALLLGAARVPAQDVCPEGRPVTGDLGIERYRCVGGACEIWSRTQAGRAHVFTTEPRVDQLDPAGEAAGKLEVGDVIVAVDDLLITTAAAGRRLASLEPGRPVRLWIRRDGREVRLTVTPVPGCGPSGLSVRIPGVE